MLGVSDNEEPIDTFSISFQQFRKFGLVLRANIFGFFGAVLECARCQETQTIVVAWTAGRNGVLP